MKRNWELIRKVALYIQDFGTPNKWISTDDPEFIEYIHDHGFSNEEVVYNLELMKDDNLIIADAVAVHDGLYIWLIRRLTSSGHDFIDKASNDTIWNKSMEKLKPLGTITIEILQSVLTAVIKESLGLH